MFGSNIFITYRIEHADQANTASTISFSLTPIQHCTCIARPQFTRELEAAPKAYLLHVDKLRSQGCWRSLAHFSQQSFTFVFRHDNIALHHGKCLSSLQYLDLTLPGANPLSPQRKNTNQYRCKCADRCLYTQSRCCAVLLYPFDLDVARHEAACGAGEDQPSTGLARYLWVGIYNESGEGSDGDLKTAELSAVKDLQWVDMVRKYPSSSH